MTNYDKIKIVVAGDSGVGKTSLVQLICHGSPIYSPGWTVGCSLDVKLHDFKAGTPQQKTYFVDFWDIGGSLNHANSRSVFYNGVNGIILVHDLTNRKSESNLRKWIIEIVSHQESFTNNLRSKMNPGSNSSLSSSNLSLNSDSCSYEFDPETFAGSNNIPIFVIGTKLDGFIDNGRSSGGRPELPTTKMRSSAIAEECRAEEIFINCMDNKSLAPGSTSAVKLSRFFDNVIERRFYRETMNIDRKKAYNPRDFVPGRFF